MSLDDALAEIRRRSRTPRDAGTAFEKLVQKALTAHPGVYGSHRFERIVRWGEWSGGDPDTGIDLVGYQRGGGLAAIQCKLYSPGSTVKKADIDGFIAKSNRSDFTARILVNTGEAFSPHASKLLNEVEPHVEMVLLDDMRRWPVTDWAACLDDGAELRWRHEPHRPKPHQERAVAAVLDGFGQHDRGQMILPCGTGKTVAALWVAERLVGLGGAVLYLVPSIALMGQTMREWASNRGMAHRYSAVCSDMKVGRVSEDQTLSELPLPVTTDPQAVAERMVPDSGAMNVMFATYQSLPRVAEAQRIRGGGGFGLAICDEAHKTTGTDRGTDSRFRLIHDNGSISAGKRLYMTATPKVYTPQAKQQAGDSDFGVYSMDDEDVYGPEFHALSFREAVDDELLSDYQVVVIAADGSVLGDGPHKNGQLSREQQVTLAGVLDALADPETEGLPRSGSRATGTVNPEVSVRRAIAFSNTIRQSKNVETYLPQVADRLFSQADPETRRKELIDLEVRHIDGTSDALTRARSLQWLRDGDTGDTKCLMLTNARCLSEGVDVPALDAVVMCAPRRSQVDVVQAVGRVMRRAEGKEVGYVVIPVIVEDGQDAADALEGSAFNEVWAVLRALRSHDERLSILVNSADLGGQKLPVTVIDVTKKAREAAEADDGERRPEQLAFSLALHNQVASMIVEKVGDRQYWKRWGQNVAQITAAIQSDINVTRTLPAVRERWSEFAADIEGEIGVEPSDGLLAQMLAQHAVTMPIFDELFPDKRFAEKNPMSLALSDVLARLKGHDCDPAPRCEPLQRFYRSVAERLSGADSGAARTGVLLEVYESFFAAAMPKEMSRLGIVYTPVEIVDFILRSADAVARQEFGRGLTDRDVHILDPFTGTGTFLSRLISGRRTTGEPLIDDCDLRRKYSGDGDDTPPELHANELVLLAYYIAAVQIQAALDDRLDDGSRPFQGLVYGDTFLNTRPRSPTLIGARRNSRRAERQNDQPIMCILGNPPWSAGQKSSGDDNPNIGYPEVADRVRDTYGRRHREVTGRAAGGNAAGNLYVQAIRWASDRLNGLGSDNPRPGIVAFVHPNSLATAPSLAGMRAALRDEFTSLYVVNLRGDAYKSGTEFDTEGSKLFGSGSRNGVQITVLVRNPEEPPHHSAELRYAAVPERSTLKQKFDWLADLGDATSDRFETVPVNARHDWVNLTDGTFEDMMAVCDTDKANTEVMVSESALGLVTGCDAYVYSFSRDALTERMRDMIAAYMDAWELVDAGCSVEEVTANDELDKIKWTDRLKRSLERGEELAFDEARIREVLYRPFTKLWLYEDDRILSSVKTITAMFPRGPQTDGGGYRRRVAEPPGGVQRPRRRTEHRSQLPRPGPRRMPDRAEAVLCEVTQQIAFGVLATAAMPDLHATGRTPRCLPRRTTI